MTAHQKYSKCWDVETGNYDTQKIDDSFERNGKKTTGNIYKIGREIQ